MAFRYEQLTVTKDILDFIAVVYQFTGRFPTEEKFGLVSQARRAATSVHLNIAEGSGRRSGVDYARFVSMALGSLLETKACFDIALRLGFVQEGEYQSMCDRVTSIWRQLCALRNSMS